MFYKQTDFMYLKEQKNDLYIFLYMHADEISTHF